MAVWCSGLEPEVATPRAVPASQIRTCMPRPAAAHAWLPLTPRWFAVSAATVRVVWMLTCVLLPGAPERTYRPPGVWMLACMRVQRSGTHACVRKVPASGRVRRWWLQRLQRWHVVPARIMPRPRSDAACMCPACALPSIAQHSSSRHSCFAGFGQPRISPDSCLALDTGGRRPLFARCWVNRLGW